jgi:multiple sugar transport system permease protein
MTQARYLRLKFLSTDSSVGVLLIAPLLLWVFLTLFYPLVFTIQLSFTNVRYVGTPYNYVGLQNYRSVLTDSDFYSSLIRTGIWTAANVVLQIVGSLIVAVVLNQEFVGKTFLRNWIVLPWVLPTVVLAIMWTWILDPTLGIVNYILQASKITTGPVKFLATPSYVLATVIIINVWRWTPYLAIIVLAALQSIPKELYEAAAVDGATALQRFRFITLPSIRSTLAVLTLFSTLWSSNIFDTIWLLTGGGPLNYSRTLPLYIYRVSFQKFRFNLGAASSVLFFIILALFAFGYLYIIYKRGLERGVR